MKSFSYHPIEFNNGSNNSCSTSCSYSITIPLGNVGTYSLGRTSVSNLPLSFAGVPNNPRHSLTIRLLLKVLANKRMIGEVFIFGVLQADMWNINFIPYVGVSIVMKEWVYHSICLSYPYSGNCTNWSGFVMNENIAFCFWIRLPKVVLNNSFLSINPPIHHACVGCGTSASFGA